MEVVETREDTHREYRWKLTVKEFTDWPDGERFGDVVLSVLDGNHGIYTERHHSDQTTLTALEDRATDIINRIHDDENIAQCTACNELYERKVDHHLHEQTLTWADRHFFKHGMDPRYKAVSTNEEAETCVYVTGRIFDTIHIITHLFDTNPFFSDEELVECDSLVMARGFERIEPDGEPRSYAELEEKYKELKRERPQGRDNREKRKELLELLEWVLKRQDRFYTNSRFKYAHLR